ncbi:hypothetical protein T11_116 [Trichinella zimbabwensis]|uniref:Uncharacterized protein n=1 Tax=Trichinella zimbabwensis TaxID=268475 RepID=A0A0V1HQR7_9BILA|nr:hypothetical protein T11_116 [Trichinella zimbabwensis]
MAHPRTSLHEKGKNVTNAESSASESMGLPRSGRRTSLWRAPKNEDNEELQEIIDTIHQIPDYEKTVLSYEAYCELLRKEIEDSKRILADILKEEESSVEDLLKKEEPVLHYTERKFLNDHPDYNKIIALLDERRRHIQFERYKKEVENCQDELDFKLQRLYDVLQASDLLDLDTSLMQHSPFCDANFFKK